jgi:hypothetical protein
MSYPGLNEFSKDSGAGEGPGSAEETLRLIARLPAPAGLEERVKAGLRNAPRRGRVLAWPGAFSPAAGWSRAAAAAAIVFVVGGGGWGIYSRVQPGQPAHGIAGPRVSGPGQFSTGDAVRRPQTLVGPTLVGPTLKSPAEAHPAPAAAPKAKSGAKSATTAMPGTKSAVTIKAVAPPVAPAVQ